MVAGKTTVCLLACAYRRFRFRERRWNIVVRREADFFPPIRERLIGITETVSTEIEEAVKEMATGRINEIEMRE